MESANSKKMEGQQIECKDMPTQRNKKIKTQSSDFTSIFLKALSSLSDRKKLIIKELGFVSILKFSCHNNIDEIFFWLVEKFDINSATVTLEDEFSFTLSSHFMDIILGFPKGSQDVITEASEECTDFIHNLLQMESPTVEYLRYLLTNEEDEESFKVIFMVLIVTVFIDPTGSSVPNPSYYPNFLHILTVKNLNWCSFTLDCLLKGIKKHLFKKSQVIHSEIGVCKILFVIPYFEFLITTELSLGSSLPRLPLWTTNVVNSYIALDSQHGRMKGFGRLPRKHISSTPFKGSKQLIHIPAEILEHINSKFRDKEIFEEKKMVQTLTTNFFQNLVKNSIPIVKSYVDDLLLVSSSNKMHVVIPSPEKGLDKQGPSYHLETMSKQECSDLVIYTAPTQPESNKKCSKEEIADFLENMFYFRDIKVPEDNDVTESAFRQLANVFSEQCSIKQDFDGFDLLMVDLVDPDFEARLIQQTVQNPINFQPERTQTFSEFLVQIKQELIEEIRSCQKPYQVHVQDCKFSFQEMRFLLPGEEEQSIGSASVQAYQGSPSVPTYQGSASVSAYKGSASIPAYQGSASVQAYQGSPSVPTYQGSASVSAYKGSASIPAYQGSASVQPYQGSPSVPTNQGSASVSAYKGSASNPVYQRSEILPAYQGPASVSAYQGSGSVQGYQGSAIVPAYQGSPILPSYQGPASVSAYQGSASLPAFHESASDPAFQESLSNTLKVVEEKTPTTPYWGLSLNERLTGKRIPPIIDEIPSFSLEDDTVNETDKNTHDLKSKSASDRLKEIDPLLHMMLDQCGKEIMEGQSFVKLKSPLPPSRELKASADQSHEQVIFATAFEHDFYTALINSYHAIRIFEMNKVWVDQRTLALSINEGGWINPSVMDCFGYLITTEQNYRRRQGNFGKNDVLKHVVIKDVTKLLMNPMLNCSDPENKRIFGLNNVGFRLENARLVHIPIPIGRQWILVVANLFDKLFDVLNPDQSIETFSSVVIYNFKNLFSQSYPGCLFNIKDFSVKYVNVPKHYFRYDSGIFVMQFIRWNNGIEVKHFSNFDVQAIREKETRQLVINKFNEQQVPIEREFIAKIAPHWLH